jgi:hypothetical protein
LTFEKSKVSLEKSDFSDVARIEVWTARQHHGPNEEAAGRPDVDSSAHVVTVGCVGLHHHTPESVSSHLSYFAHDRSGFRIRNVFRESLC